MAAFQIRDGRDGSLQLDHQEPEVALVFEYFSSLRFMVLDETRSVRGGEDGGN
jgi:hypothetical protein